MIGILTAIEDEIAPFEEAFIQTQRIETHGIEIRFGTLGETDVVLVVSGIGTTNAAIATTLLIEHGCDTIIMSGVAGGLGSLGIGDVYVSNACVYHDVDATAFGYALGQIPGEPIRFEASSGLVSMAGDCGAMPGVIASGNVFESRNPAKVTAIRTMFDADAIDMESCAVAHACTKANVDWLIIRGVSDHADREAKDSFEARLELAAKRAAACTLKLVESLSVR